MSLSRFLTAFVCAASMLSLSSCVLGGRADIVNPTIAQMDSLDVQWGLTPRKSKGGPRRTYQYLDTGAGNAAAAGTAPAQATAPARENVSAPPPASTGGEAAAPAPSQPVPASLR